MLMWGCDFTLTILQQILKYSVNNGKTINNTLFEGADVLKIMCIQQ